MDRSSIHAATADVEYEVRMMPARPSRPCEQFSHSGTGDTLLKLIGERSARVRPGKLADARIFTPLDMTVTRPWGCDASRRRRGSSRRHEEVASCRARAQYENPIPIVPMIFD